MTQSPRSQAPAVYRLRVAGHLDHYWSPWFGELTLTHEDDGMTSLTGVVADQAELHGLLTKIRDLGVTLISVAVVDSADSVDHQPGSPDTRVVVGKRPASEDFLSSFPGWDVQRRHVAVGQEDQPFPRPRPVGCSRDGHVDSGLRDRIERYGSAVRSESDQPSGPAGAQARDDLNRIASYLARRDIASLTPGVVPRADVLVLCGSAVLAAIDLAANAFHHGLADRLLVSGGVGHSTPYLRRAISEDPRYGDVATEARSESAVIDEILRSHHAVPGAAILIEDKSTNCGENAQFSVDLLTLTPLPLQSVLLLQDPTMQRRTHECFRRSLPDAAGVRVVSYAPFVPAVPDGEARNVHDEDGRAVWSMRRFTALCLGEMRRLYDDVHGYGPRGADFIDHVDIPSDVMDAYQRLAAAHPPRSVAP